MLKNSTNQNKPQVLRQQTFQSQPYIANSVSSSGSNHSTVSSELISSQNKEFQTSFGFNLQGTGNLQNFSKNILSNKENLSVSGSGIFNMLKKKQQITVSSQHIQKITTAVDSYTFLPTANLKILQPLKSNFRTQSINKELKNKKFDFNRQFYKQALGLVASLGFKEHPDYSYLQEQDHICGLIFQLTEEHASPVDENRQNLVAENLRKCKYLFSKLDCHKTVNIMKKYLKMEGKGLPYLIGQLSLQVDVPSQLIEKHVQNPKFKQIATMLYLMSYFGKFTKIQSQANSIIQYLSFLHSQRDKICQNSKQSQTKILSHLALCKRILQLCLFSLISDPMHTKITTWYSKILSVMPSPPAALTPSYFITFFQSLAMKNPLPNIYTTRSKMTDFIQEHPICCFCLGAIDEEISPGKKIDMENGQFLHLQCEEFADIVGIDF